MLLRVRTALSFKPGCSWLCLFVVFALGLSAQAASLQTFIVVFGQLTNEISAIQQNFDNSTVQKQRLALLNRARSTILDESLRDEQALSQLVTLLGDDESYTATLDESAFNARGTVLARYNLIGTRVADLPPSRRANLARERFQNLAEDRNTLENAQHAEGIANQLAPFGARVESVAKSIPRAQVMPKPGVRLNSVRATVNGRRFNSTASDRNSPNIFDVTAPTPFYWDLNCRVVDGERVLYFNLPVVSEQIRYEVAQGLASVSFSPDVFATNTVILAATNGTFFVQSDRKEIYGLFSCEGPGFQITEGKFRIELPRALNAP